MRRNSTLFFFLMIIVCVGSAAQAETRSFEISDFSAVSAGYGMKLDISPGNYRVEVTADPQVFDRLKVEKRGDTLRLSIERSGWGWTRGDIEVSILMPALTGLDLSGGAAVRLNGMDSGGRSFEASLSGGARIDGQLSCGEIEIEASGGSQVQLAGEGGRLELEGSGGSRFQLHDFTVGDVEAELSGGSEAAVTMTGSLKVDQSGGSEFVYYGNPTVERSNSSGGSKIRKGN